MRAAKNGKRLRLVYRWAVQSTPCLQSNYESVVPDLLELSMNTLKTILLLGLMTSLIVSIGGLLGGRDGVIIAFVFAVVMNVGSYWFSDRIALAAHGAVPIGRDDAPGLYDMVERLAKRAGIPVPPVYLIPSDSPNAFATGRDPQHAAVAVTEGILRLLDDRELEGVIAHELSHVKNRDVLITTIAAVMASVITWIAHTAMFFGGGDRANAPNPIFALFLALVAPFAAMIINLAISRSREFEADATGASISGEPLDLARALAKIDQSARNVPMVEANPAFSSLYISNPNPQSFLVKMLSTHPPTEERIRRLREISVSGQKRERTHV